MVLKLKATFKGTKFKGAWVDFLKSKKAFSMKNKSLRTKFKNYFRKSEILEAFKNIHNELKELGLIY